MNYNKYNLDPKLKCVKCQQSLPRLDCNPDFFRYFINGKDNHYCDACLPHDLLEQRIEREHFKCFCKGGKIFNKCHDLRREYSNNRLYWDNGTFKFECYHCGGKLGKNGEKIYECEEPHCERKFCSCSCRSRTLRCRKPNHQTQNNQNSPNENFEQVQKDYQRVHEKAQSWWNTLSGSEREKELAKVVENLKLGEYEGGKLWRGNKDMEGYGSGWACDGSFWQIKNGKYVSRQPHLVPCEIAEEFMEREFGKVDLALVLRDYQIIKRDSNDSKDSLPSPNPTSHQFLTNWEGKSDNEISNYPNSNPEPNQSSAGSIKTIKFENKEKDDKNNATDSVEKSTNRNLVINLRTVKQITLTADGNLIIEFNNSENNSNSQAIQTITNEQINDNQELQKVKNYLQKSKQKSASQQDLKSILENSSSAVEKPKNGNNSLLIGGIGTAALIIGVVIGLLMKRNKKNNNK